MSGRFMDVVMVWIDNALMASSLLTCFQITKLFPILALSFGNLQ